MPYLKMTPLMPVGELHRKPLSECGSNESRLIPCKPPTVTRGHHQHASYWVDGKTVVGGDACACIPRLLRKGTLLRIPPDCFETFGCCVEASGTTTGTCAALPV